MEHVCFYLNSKNSVTRPHLAARKAGRSILNAGACAWLKKEDSIMKKRRLNNRARASSTVYGIPSNLTGLKWKYYLSLNIFSSLKSLGPFLYPYTLAERLFYGTGVDKGRCHSRKVKGWAEKGLYNAAELPVVKDPKQKMSKWSKWGWGSWAKNKGACWERRQGRFLCTWKHQGHTHQPHPVLPPAHSILHAFVCSFLPLEGPSCFSISRTLSVILQDPDHLQEVFPRSPFGALMTSHWRRGCELSHVSAEFWETRPILVLWGSFRAGY